MSSNGGHAGRKRRRSSLSKAGEWVLRTWDSLWGEGKATALQPAKTPPRSRRRSRKLSQQAQSRAQEGSFTGSPRSERTTAPRNPEEHLDTPRPQPVEIPTAPAPRSADPPEERANLFEALEQKIAQGLTPSEAERLIRSVQQVSPSPTRTTPLSVPSYDREKLGTPQFQVKTPARPYVQPPSRRASLLSGSPARKPQAVHPPVTTTQFLKSTVFRSKGTPSPSPARPRDQRSSRPSFTGRSSFSFFEENDSLDLEEPPRKKRMYSPATSYQPSYGMDVAMSVLSALDRISSPLQPSKSEAEESIRTKYIQERGLREKEPSPIPVSPAPYSQFSVAPPSATVGDKSRTNGQGATTGPSRRVRRERVDDPLPYQRGADAMADKEEPETVKMPRKEDVQPFQFSVPAISFGSQSEQLSVPKRKEEFSQNPTTPNFGPVESPSVIPYRDSSPSNKKQPPSVHNFPSTSFSFSSTPEFSAASPLEAYKSPRAFGEGMEQPLTPTANFQVVVEDYEEKSSSSTFGAGSSPFFQSGAGESLYPSLPKKSTEESDSMEDDTSGSDNKSHESSSPFGDLQFGGASEAKDNTAWNIPTTFTGVSFGATSSDASASSAQEDSESTSSPSPPPSLQFGSTSQASSSSSFGDLQFGGASEAKDNTAWNIPTSFTSVSFGSTSTDASTSPAQEDSESPASPPPPLVQFGSTTPESSSPFGVPQFGGASEAKDNTAWNIPTTFTGVSFGATTTSDASASSAQEDNESSPSPPPAVGFGSTSTEAKPAASPPPSVQFGSTGASIQASWDIPTAFTNVSFGASSAVAPAVDSAASTSQDESPSSPCTDTPPEEATGITFGSSSSEGVSFDIRPTFGAVQFGTQSFKEETTPPVTSFDDDDDEDETLQEEPEKQEEAESKAEPSVQFGAQDQSGVSFSIPTTFNSGVTFGSASASTSSSEAKEDSTSSTDSSEAPSSQPSFSFVSSNSGSNPFNSGFSFSTSSVTTPAAKDAKDTTSTKTEDGASSGSSEFTFGPKTFSFGTSTEFNPFASTSQSSASGGESSKPNLNFSFGKSEGGNPFAQSLSQGFATTPAFTFGASTSTPSSGTASTNIFSFGAPKSAEDKGNESTPMDTAEPETSATTPSKDTQDTKDTSKEDSKEEGSQPATAWVGFGNKPVTPFEYFTQNKDN